MSLIASVGSTSNFSVVDGKNFSSFDVPKDGDCCFSNIKIALSFSVSVPEMQESTMEYMKYVLDESARFCQVDEHMLRTSANFEGVWAKNLNDGLLDKVEFCSGRCYVGFAQAALCVCYYGEKMSIGSLEETTDTEAAAFICRDNHVTREEGEFDSVRVMKEYCREAKVAQIMLCQLLGHALGPVIRGLNLDMMLEEDSKMFGKVHRYYRWLEKMVASDKDKTSVVTEYKKKVSFWNTLFACSACGIRDFSIRYQKVSLYDSCIEKLKYSPEQNHDLEMEALRSREYHKVRSFFVDPKNAKTRFHLHPELVIVEIGCEGKTSVMLCQKCSDCLEKENRIPPMSIAAGCDYGLLNRIQVVEFNAISDHN